MNKKWLLLTLLVTVLCVPNLAVSATFKNIIAFGDSISDNGFDDGHGFARKSNGKVWVEYLGEKIGCSLIEDRAWSGAMSGQGNYNPPAKDWSGLLWQVENYVPAKKINMEKTLFTIQIGTNDLHDPTKGITPQQVIDNVIAAMEGLSVKGAKHFMVWNMPVSLVSPGYTDPNYEWYSYYAPLLDKALAQYKEYNELIEVALADFAKKHPMVTVSFFDADSALEKIKVTFANSTEPWHGSYLYPEPGKWLWWDHWHYMTETHRKIAEAAAATLKKSLLK